MRATDLTFDCWVYNRNDKTKTPFKVKKITKNTVMDLSGCYSNLVDICPIPLTSEILEKNGFIQNGIGSEKLEEMDVDNVDYTYVWSCKDTKIFIYLEGDYFVIEITSYKMNVDGIKIKHVHQLQQVLRLCSVEKEIKL